MADTIRLRAGKKENMPELMDREVGYVRDENAFYIGTPDGNKKVSGSSDGGTQELSAYMKNGVFILE